MTVEEMENIYTEGQLELSLESARDNIKKILADKPDRFSKPYKVPDTKAIYNKALLKHQADKSKSLQSVSVESYCMAMGMEADDQHELMHLLEQCNGDI